MNDINEKNNTIQIQEYTHCILVGDKFIHIKADSNQHLNECINSLADTYPNEKISVFEVILNPLPLKRKTIYTV